MDYIYEKTGVNNEKLSLEISNSTIIVIALTSVTFNEPNGLKIVFPSSLTQAENDELDAIVSAHDGQSLNHYRLYCNDCADYKSIRLASTPSECPSCEGIDITNIVEQTPCKCVADELSNDWELFVTSDGSIINARRH